MKFKTELQRVRRKFKEGRLLAEKSHISVGSISRMLTGKGHPSLKMVYKLLAVVDSETGSRLLAAYLTDQIRPALREHLCICIREKEGAQPSCQCWDPLVQKVLALRPEVRSHLEVIVTELLQPGSDLTPVIHLGRWRWHKK
jgi:transcriptional regulator with XRE-family HTH domain